MNTNFETRKIFLATLEDIECKYEIEEDDRISFN